MKLLMLWTTKFWPCP